MGGNWGVNVFVLISGYFLIEDKISNFNIKKIFVFLGQILFYSILIYTLFCIFDFRKFSFMALIKTLFPITFNSYQSNSLLWFITLYCVAAYIQKFGLNSKLMCKHYAILFIIFSLLRYLWQLYLQCLEQGFHLWVVTRLPFMVSSQF